MAKRRFAGNSVQRSLALENLEERRVLTSIIGYPFHDQQVVVPQDSSGTEFSVGVIPYVRDFDGVSIISDSGAGLPISIVSQPTHGEVTIDAESYRFTYTPDADYIGEDHFEYTVGEIGDPRQVDLIVSETVYAVPDWAQVDPAVETQRIDVLANDYVLESLTSVDQTNWEQGELVFDVAWPFFGGGTGFRWQTQQNDLTIVGVVDGSHGQVSVGGDGTHLDYTPAQGFEGIDTVRYIVEDAVGHQSAASVTVEVSGQVVDDARYTSEAEFVHAQVDRWMSHHAAGLCQDRSSFGYFPVLASLSFDQGPSETIIAADRLNDPQAVSVQEGDIVKTDGDYLYVVSNAAATYDLPWRRMDIGHTAGWQPSTLTILDVRDPANPEVVSSVEFDQPITDLFLSDGRVTAITEKVAGFDMYGYSQQREYSVHVLDVSSPATPRVAFSSTLEGDYHESRVIDGQLFTIAGRDAGLQLPSKTSLVALGSVVTSPGSYVEVMLERGTSQFLPSLSVSSGNQNTVIDLVTWTEVDRVAPDDLAHSSQIVITAFDLSSTNGIPVDVELTNLTHLQTIHVSTDSIYLVGSGEIAKYAFETDGSGVEFAASGAFEGDLLNQFAINEFEGRLRLAASDWLGHVDIHVMEQVGTSLEIVGSLTDIAPGENIYATRFNGNRGFVVTFRTVDPLFVIDFSNPTQPTIAGQLKVPGYSNFLKVIDENHVLGIGRNADEWSGLFDELQISLFDISDPAMPLLVDRYSFSGGRTTWSPLVENPRSLTNHQAVTFVEEGGVLALPIYSQESWGPEAPFIFEGDNSAVRLFQIDVSAGITELGQVEFADRALRSVPLTEHLISMSDTTIKITPLTDPNTLVSSLELPSTGAHNIDMLPFVDGPDVDINQDGLVTPLDALLLINESRINGFGDLQDVLDQMSDPQEIAAAERLDVNLDGVFSVLDPLHVINALNREPEPLIPQPVTPQPALSASAEIAAVNVDALFASTEDDSEEEEEKER